MAPPPNRQARVLIARETLKILERGSYDNRKGDAVDVAEDVRNSVEGSTVWNEKDLEAARKRTLAEMAEKKDSASSKTAVEVTGENAVSACRRLVSQVGEDAGIIGCLNFASAKNVCGGMINGSLAQEESIGLCSGLHACLSSPVASEYYSANRSDPRDGAYSDSLVYSPAVPVFRDDDRGYELTDRPVRVSFVSCPAVNRTVLDRRRGGSARDEANQLMRRRIANVLSVFRTERASCLVLGAWGCGVFGNDPADVAGMFADAVGNFDGCFDRIVFAVGEDRAKVDVFRRAMLKQE